MKIQANEVAVFALGGLNEVGKNCYAIQYKDEIILIDFGGLFPDDSLLGVDLIIPGIDYLKKNEDKIVGLFITHGHLDHIGGIPYLLRNINIEKIYSSGLATGLIKKNVSSKLLGNKLIEFFENTVIKTKFFEITFYRTNHSIPDSYGIAIKTKHGYIVHSGDFKFDFTPIGPMTNFAKMAKIAEEGVLCLLSDSTNSLLPGFTMSEKKVGNSIKTLFTNIEGRTIVASFASNIHRVEQIVEASIACNRKVAVFGRSMENNIKVSQEMGYLSFPKNTFISTSEIKKLPANEVTILCTGSQGEPLAALSRISTGTHREISITPGDTVIFSSNPIPGNAYYVNKTMNNLCRRGAKVIKNSPLTDVHTSGHAGQGEQKLLLSLMRPEHFLPIHGEFHMLCEHAETAAKYGIPNDNIHLLSNGKILAFDGKSSRIVGKINTDGIYIKGNTISDINNTILRQRKILSENGILAIVVSINTVTKKLLTNPLIVSRGFIYIKGNLELTNKIRQVASDTTKKYLTKNNFDLDELKKYLLEAVKKIVYELTERSPMIIPVIKHQEKRNRNF